MAPTVARLKSLSVSAQKGTAKTNVAEVDLRADWGVVGDAHAGPGPRQVSLLAAEAIQALRDRGRIVPPGGMGENLTVEGLDLAALQVGDRLRIGTDAELEISQRGKQCHGRCEIFRRIGDCIMPREGVFARVTRPGRIRVGDAIEVMRD